MMDPTALAMLAMPPPPISGRLQNLNRKKNWDEAEDETLVRCWLKAVELHKSAETRSAEFWRIVTYLFQKHTTRDEERTDDACSQRFNNLSRACTKWLAAREAVREIAAYKNRDDDQIAEMIQDQYKRLMGADKPFKYFRVLEILKNSPKWLEHSAQLSLKSREQAVTGKTRMQLMGQSKMKLNRDFDVPQMDYARSLQLVQAIQANMQLTVDQHALAYKELAEKTDQFTSEIASKLDSLGQILMLKTLPEAERAPLLSAQLAQRMQILRAQEQEERKRKLENEIANLELEHRKKAMLERPTIPTPL